MTAPIIEDTTCADLNTGGSAAERCAVDGRSLELLGAAPGDQLLIRLRPGRLALCTVVERLEAGASEVRVGRRGMLRLSGGGSQQAPRDVTLETAFTGRVIEPGVSLTEELHGDSPAGVAVLAPHGGRIEFGTDAQAVVVQEWLVRRAKPSRAWIVTGLNPAGARAWHITSAAISERSFPLLAELFAGEPRGPFAHAVAFHGHDDSPAIVVGGGLPDDARQTALKHRLADRIRGALDTVMEDPPPVAVRLDGPLAGALERNIVNRLTVAGNGLQIEQPIAVREATAPRDAIARAVAGFYASIA